MSLDRLPCEILFKIAENLGPGDYYNLAYVNKHIQICLDTGSYNPTDAARAKQLLDKLRQQYSIYYIPKEQSKEMSYNVLKLYKSVEYGLNTKEEFESFISKLLPSRILIDDEDNTVIDAVYEAEYALGSYEPLNSGQYIIVFSYPEKRVRYMYRGTYRQNQDDYVVLWSK